MPYTKEYRVTPMESKCDILELQDQMANTFLIHNQLGVSHLPFSLYLRDDQ